MTVAVKSDLDELIDLLAHEERLYGQLIDISTQEQAAIVGTDPTGLSGLIADKERVLEGVARTEIERQSWIATWTAVRSLSPDTTLAELIGLLDPAEAVRVGAMRDALLRRVRDMAAMNNQNNQLLSGALRIVNRSIDAYNRVGGGQGYEQSGNRARASRTIVLDRRA